MAVPAELLPEAEPERLERLARLGDIVDEILAAAALERRDLPLHLVAPHVLELGRPLGAGQTFELSFGDRLPRAIAGAGGTLTVSSLPGRGSTFIVEPPSAAE